MDTNNFYFYIFAIFLSYLFFPVVALWSCLLYIVGQSGDNSPTLTCHLRKAYKRIQSDIASNINYPRLHPPSTFSRVLGKVSETTTGKFEANQYGEICSTLKTGKKIYWIHKERYIKRDDPVMLYIHGGALVFQCEPFYIEFLLYTLYHLKRRVSRVKLSIAIIDYSLLPDAKFPLPLEECLEGYFDLTVVQGFQKVLIAGNSAGGLLSVTTATALKKKISLVSNYFLSPIVPSGLILLSPWLGSLPTNSVKKFKYCDHVTFRLVEFWGNVYAKNEIDLFRSPWINPCLGSTGFWDGSMPADTTFVMYGSRELGVDHIETWIKSAHIPDENVYKDEGNNHEGFINDLLDANLKMTTSIPSFEQFLNWIELLSLGPSNHDQIV